MRERKKPPEGTATESKRGWAQRPWDLWAPGAHTAIIFRLDTAIIFRLDTAIIFRLDTAIIGPFLEGPSRFFKNLLCSQKCHINDLELLLKSYFRRISTRICFILQ